jgi:hypothetical protein
MDQCTTTSVAMDTHKNTIAVALAVGGRRGETRFVGEIPSRPDAVAKLVERLASKHGKLAFCYEAGPATGFIDRSRSSDINAWWLRRLSFRSGRETA